MSYLAQKLIDANQNSNGYIRMRSNNLVPLWIDTNQMDLCKEGIQCIYSFVCTIDLGYVVIFLF